MKMPTIRIPIILALFLFFSTSLIAQKFQEVSIYAPDKVVLSGNYFSPNQPGPGILLLSMCDPTTTQIEWTMVAQKLKRMGFHVLTFDYRGFGKSGGSMPNTRKTIGEAMDYWRANWVKDVSAAYKFLLSQKGVNSNKMAIGGASCGVFMGMEFALDQPNIKTFVSLGGPIDDAQQARVKKRRNLPMLILGANEGPTLEWSDALFNASNHKDTKFTKYKYVTHGTGLFKYVPGARDQVANWFQLKLK